MGEYEILGLCISIFAALTLFVSIYFLLKFYVLKKQCKIKTTAKVVKYRKRILWGKGDHYPSNTARSYYPVLEYTVGQDVYTEAYFMSKTWKDFKIGDIVDIFYNANNPRHFFICAKNYHRSINAFLVCVFIAGLFLSFLSVCVFSGLIYKIGI
ncbi:MAG: DUF3592 domain-containing protein [Dysgonomonas sp.]|nr:DUF3592 domain-containing protein [Dysgonomonas sp.]